MRERILSVWREGDGGARCVDRSLELGAWCVDRSLELGVWIRAWSLELGAWSLELVGVWIGAWRALAAKSAYERDRNDLK